MSDTPTIDLARRAPAPSADDCEAIRQLVARYNFAIDLGQVDDWVACFTPDGVFECLGLPEGAVTGGRHEGADALRRYAEGHFDQNQGRARHWNWNLLIEADGTGAEPSASMTCYLNAFSGGRGSSAVLRATGIYRARLVERDGRWLFASRQVTVDPA
jgi:ketosteroid isomerase-like protein